jgi:UDP-N-acetylglucosamine--N-acetylmuramyl-(pentapeptide) pyrophosphoryl-undecaprenol N-acetylglucosamine transferase
MHRIPVVLHESDITPGLANRITAPFAKAVCTTFPEAAKAIGAKGVYTGTPLRETLFTGNKKRGLALAGFNGEKPVLLMMGGSTGAASVNAALREALPELLTRFDILHIVGKGNLDASLNRTVGYRQFEYLDAQLPDAFAAADIMLSRAGANALSEILALRIPSLLIPLPLSASRGDQILNAKSFEERGFAKVLEQEQMTAKTLVKAIESLYHDRTDIAEKMRAEPASNGIAGVMKQIEQYAIKS